jgi:hypothetical protein
MNASRNRILFFAVAILTGLSLSWVNSRSLTSSQATRPLNQGANVYDGSYCIDGHAHWAEGIRNLLVSGFGSESVAELQSLRPAGLPDAYLTPFTIVGPTVTAVLSLATGGIVSAYHVSSLLAVLLAILLTAKAAREVTGRRDTALLCAAVLTSHYLVMRAALALHQEPWALAATAAMLERSITFVRRRCWVTLVGAAVLSVWTKMDGAILGIGAAGAVIAFSAVAGRIRPRPALGALAGISLAAALAFSLPVLLLSEWFEMYRGRSTSFAVDPMIVVDLLILLQLHAVLLFRYRAWMREPALVGSAVALVAYLGLVIGFVGGPSQRYLVPAVAPLVLVSSIALEEARPQLRRLVLWALLLGNAGLLLTVIALRE